MSTVPPRRRAPTGAAQPRKPKTDENSAPQQPIVTRHKATTVVVDPYSEEFEKKFNVEGSNVQEIVYLRQDNDAVNGQHTSVADH